MTDNEIFKMIVEERERVCRGKQVIADLLAPYYGKNIPELSGTDSEIYGTKMVDGEPELVPISTVPLTNSEVISYDWESLLLMAEKIFQKGLPSQPKQ